ncbi:type II secretion system F family protein [Paraburkholderia acidisoli]|uniref:Pilus assembly protein n=1 Tax=Paraburkholderia acidisoli TaxID=2571748 RepID=A0A7Z2GEJ1_9BURK|nr:type II secretion system F family protein [Paraburkholderia acidisoli]QGZ60362.1 pilus assembly protein [Paraburkholderia acidisoli]
MSPADIVTAGAFLGVIFIGLILSTLRDARRAQPEVRIRVRLQEIQTLEITETVSPDAKAAELFKLRSPEGWLEVWYRRHRQRLATIGGSHGMKWMVVAAVLGFVASIVASKLPWIHGPFVPLLFLLLPALAVVMAYRMLNRRFSTRFLKAFPDTLDLVIRAVRAGVPVTYAIAAAGEQADEPVRTEFRTMGDALKLGIDVFEVLDAANARIEISDFAFFAVCLRLQRETGGQLSETLENLATIIRARRDMKLKTKALTAEGRMTSKIIAAVPFVIMAALYLMNPQYLDPLFATELGRDLLGAAGVLMSIGLMIVNKMAKLETN